MSAALALLSAIESEFELLRLRLLELRKALTPPPTARVERPPLPERCAGIPVDQCALQDEDAQQSRKSFSDPRAWQCAGCGFVSTTTT